MALTREAFVGFALPMIGWLWPQDGPLKAVLRSAAAVASALVCYLLLLRLAPVAQRGRQPVSAYLRRAAATYLAHAAQRPAFTIAITFTGSLGIWWLLGVAGWRSARGLWWWLLPVFGAFLFGGDWSRFAFYAFPVIVPAGAIAVWQHRHRWLLLGLLALQAAVPLVDLAVDGKLLLNRQQPSLELTVLLAVLTLPALLWPIRRSRGEEALSRLGLSSPHIGKEDAGQDGYQRV